MINLQEEKDLLNTVQISARRFEESPFIERHDTSKMIRGVYANRFQAEDGIRDTDRSRGLGDVYKRQPLSGVNVFGFPFLHGLLGIEGSIGSYQAPVLINITPDLKLLSITIEA